MVLFGGGATRDRRGCLAWAVDQALDVQPAENFNVFQVNQIFGNYSIRQLFRSPARRRHARGARG